VELIKASLGACRSLELSNHCGYSWWKSTYWQTT